MSPTVHAFVQVGLNWQELPLAPQGDATASVLKVEGTADLSLRASRSLDSIPSVPLALPTLGIAGTVPAVYFVAPALACAGGYIVYWRLAGLRRSAVTQRRERIAADSLRGVAWVRKPRSPMLERPRRAARLPAAPAEPVELRIVLAIPPGEDDDAAAALATQAMAEMTHGEGIPPVCARQRTAAGGVVLDIRFHVRNLRRGRAHVLADAQARLWDVLHTHRIPFALGPPPAPSRPATRRRVTIRCCVPWLPSPGSGRARR
jgi:hypothetical protein